MTAYKKMKGILLVVLALVIAVCFAACNKKTDDNKQANSTESASSVQSSSASTGDSSAPAPTLVISSETLNIEEDETFTLTVQKSDNSEVGTVVWASSDESVATVSGGTVTAVSEGTATVTATAGGLSASCAVTVYASEEYPVMALSKYNVILLIGDEINVFADISYKGKTAEVTDLAAKSGDGSVVTASVDGTKIVLTAIAYGETNVTVTASYKGKAMQRSVAVKVNEDVQFSVEESAEIYTYAFGEYTSEKTLDYSVIVSGVAQTDPEIEWSVDDNAVVSVDNGKITAVGTGEATVSAKYVSAGGIEHVKTCVVTVIKTVADLGTNAEVYLNAADGSNVISLSDDLGVPALSDITMKNAATGEAITLTEVTGGYTVDLAAGCYSVTFSSESANAEFNAEITVITKVIKTLEELDDLASYGEFTDNTENKTFTLKGFFVLGANIDATGHEFIKYRNYFESNDKTVGLVGGFDGKGYTVYGGIYYRQGLFGSIAEGSIVRNLALSNVTLPYENAGGAIAMKNYGTIDNCLVDVAEADKAYCAMSAICNLNYGTISNCVTSFPLVGKTNDQSRAICEYNNASDAAIVNSYAITDDTAVYNAGGGIVDVNVFAYGTAASTIVFSGLNEYFDMTGDKPAFASLKDIMVVIEKNKEDAAKAFIDGIVEEELTLRNGSEVSLIETIEYTAYRIVGLDEGYEALITIGKGKITVSELADEDFTFGVEYYYEKDESIAKTITYSVVTTKILDKTVDLFLDGADGDMAFDVVADLGVTAGVEYALSLEDGTPVAFSVSGTELTVDGLEAGEHTLVLDVDGAKYSFVAAVITKAISSYAEFCEVRDANTVDGVWRGYFILTEDIAMPTDVVYSSGVSYFDGTFDGRGHTVYGGSFHSNVSPVNSPFANLRGTLKNTAFIDCVIGITSGVCHSITEGGLMDNCLVDAVRLGNTLYSNQSIIYHVAPAGKISNSVFYFAGGNAASGDDKGAFAMLGGVTENVYVFATKITGWDYRGESYGSGITTGVSLYAYDTVLANANVKGLNDYFDLTGDKATFGFDYDAWYARFIKAEVEKLEIATLTARNGDEIDLPSLPDGVNWEVAYADASFDGSVVIAGKKLTVNAVKEGAFTFTLTAKYSEDETVKKEFVINVTYTAIINGIFDFENGAPVTLSLTADLGIGEGTAYSLKNAETDESVSFNVAGGNITIDIPQMGEYDLLLDVDGSQVRFAVAAVTEVIDTAEKLAAFASRSNNGYYVLGGNINASGYTFMNTDATFDGTFDGRGYAISNGSFSAANGNLPGGLFGTINAGATVKNLAVTNAMLTTEENYNWVYTSILTGGGRNSGTIKDCYIEIAAKGSSTHAMGICSHSNGGSVIDHVIIKSVGGLEKNVCDMVLGNASITNTYVIGGAATNNGWVEAPASSVVSITNVTALSAAQQETFDPSIWGFNDGIPYFVKAA